LDTASGSLWQGDDLIPLRPKLYALLATLAAHAGEVMTKEALLDAGWPEMAVSEGVLKTCMAQVRQALGETATAPTYIATVHRRGYRFIAPVLPVEASADTPPSQVIAPGVGPAPVTALVSRESELDQLYQCWRLVRQGIRQIVMVTGEAGIGKTSVVDAFVAQLAATETFWVGRGQCIEQYGAGEAYLPLLEVLGELGRRPDGTHLLELLHEQAPSWLLQLPALVPFEAYDALQRRGQGATQARMLRELAEAVESLTVDRPLVMVLEDLHWSDVSTLDWLSSVARRRPAARLLVLGTYRPTDAVVHQHPVHAVIQELLVHGQCRELALGYVHEAGIATYLAKRFGECIWLSRLAHVLHQRTRGNPLFLITVVDELVRQGTLMPGATGWELEGEPTSVAVEVPENLWQVIERQRVQLATEDQMLLEAASVAGVEFAAALVASCVDRETEALEARYDTLARQGQFVQSRGTVAWPDGTVTAQYAFRHALYHEFLYARVPASRQVRWHRQFGRRLEAAYGSQTSEIAAALTMHYVRGQDAGRAVHYLHKAGEQAVRRSASQEALPHLTTAFHHRTHL
jgi:predicted ATPase